MDRCFFVAVQTVQKLNCFKKIYSYYLQIPLFPVILMESNVLTLS